MLLHQTTPGAALQAIQRETPIQSVEGGRSNKQVVNGDEPLDSAIPINRDGQPLLNHEPVRGYCRLKGDL